MTGATDIRKGVAPQGCRDRPTPVDFHILHLKPIRPVALSHILFAFALESVLSIPDLQIILKPT